VISDLLYACGKQEYLQSRVKGQIPKKDCKYELVGFRCSEEMGFNRHFCFQKRECDSVLALMPGNWIIDYYHFSFWKYVDRINSFVQPIRYLIWLLVLSVLY